MVLFAIYRIRAQPGKGRRRSYVGAIRVVADDPEVAVETRFKLHMEKGPKSAAWLRPCCPKSAVKELLRVEHSLLRAMQAELYFTFQTMLEPYNTFLTRGACFCRVDLPWADVMPMLSAFEGQSLDSFAESLAPLDLLPDVVLHLAGKCYRYSSINSFRRLN